MTHTLVIVAAMCATLGATAIAADAPAKSEARFFELRTYTAATGKLAALQDRFRQHTIALFEKHGMTVIAFWTPTEEKLSQNTLIYVLAYPSRDAREKSWKEFQDDPDWKKAKADSEKDGTLVLHVDSVYMTPTEYSPIR